MFECVGDPGRWICRMNIPKQLLIYSSLHSFLLVFRLAASNAYNDICDYPTHWARCRNDGYVSLLCICIFLVASTHLYHYE